MQMQFLLFLILHFSLTNLTLSIGNVENNKYDLDSPLKEIIWCGENNHISIVLTELSSVYRSEDKGLHWNRLTELFTSIGIKELSQSENDIGKVTKVIQSPADNNLLIFIGSKGINWVGQECGKSIHALNHGRPINEYIFHPTEREWALASAFTQCEDFIDNEPCKLYKEVFVTKDLGKTWSQISSYVIQFGWGVVGKDHIAKGIPKERILMTFEPHGKGDQNQKGWSYKVDFVYSDDFFNTIKVSVAKGNKFLLTNDNLFVAEVMDQDAQEVLLLGANSTVKDYVFNPIITNQNSYLEHSYSFLDTSLHSVFLHVNHFGPLSHYGHIYISGPRGLRYSLSLRNNVRSDDHQCDFEKVKSVEGVYIANAISGKYMKIAKREMEIETYAARDSMGNEDPNSNSRNANKKTSSYKDYIKTFVTFNKGGDWKRLLSPQRDVNGKIYDCGNYCYLNLFGIGYSSPQFYSVESASGIILANGNVGHYLKYDEVSTFLSRDGGLNWLEIQKGSHIYEIGDHGGLIIIADNKNMTDKIKYTWDEGLTWEEMKISDEKILIDNIIIEPSSSSHHFIVYGSSYKNGDKKGVIIGLDFGKVYPQCQNPSAPNTPTSDYELWTPNDGRTGHMCLLGHKTTIVRRKRESHCVNNEQFERKVTIENCDCTEDDYQCDVGFERLEPGQPCTRISKEANESMIYNPPSDCSNYYSISRGYRLIPGDTCVNGFSYDPIILACPYSYLYTGMRIMFYVIAFAIAAWIIYWIISNREYIFGDSMSKGEIYHFVNTITDEDNVLFEEEEKKAINSNEKNTKKKK